MEALDCIFSRRSRKEFVSKPIEFDKIIEILNAGHHAPSAGNLQNWKFVVITEKDKLSKLPEICHGQDYANSTLAIVICSDDTDSGKHFSKSKTYNSQAAGAVMQNMLLAANNFAIGGVWIGAFKDKELKTMLSIPENMNVEGILCMGYSNQIPHEKKMHELRKVVYFNEWDNKTKKLQVITQDYADVQEKFFQAAKSTYEKGMDHLKKKLRINKD